MKTPSWITIPRPLPGARLRLICLPHAGAGASSFFSWGSPFQAADIEVRPVQYPGRETRLAETPLNGSAAMVRVLADAWPELSGGGANALYGHSMGALLAFELALELTRRGVQNLPQRLFLSGRNPPHAPRALPRLSELPDQRFLEEIAARYGGFPPELLAHPEMVALITPILRADFELVDTYAWSGASPLDIPLSIFGGTADPWTSAAELDEWRRHSLRDVTVRIFDGDHFFHQKLRQDVIAAVLAGL